jgi:LacI family repressor for deo operon, udp, cdd, tsx, nupC, and nupG
MPNIKDVAREAGVSVATVSRVLRNEKSVLEPTRDKVLKAIQKLDYHPNAFARNLRNMESKIILVIVPDVANTFFHDILKGIYSIANANGYQVLISDLANNTEEEAQYLNALSQRLVDGVISLSANAARSLLERISEKFPLVVACQYLEDSVVPNVTIDNIDAAKTIVNHLISEGHTRIAHLSSHPEMLLYRDRMNGYIQALAENNLPIDLELVCYDTPDIAGGQRQTQLLLEMKNRPTAIFAAGDILAIGSLKSLKAAKVGVPEEISVVGFDDIEFSSIIEPALTTIRQPKYLMGEKATEILLKLIKGKKLRQNQELLEYELIIRQSSGKNRMEESR